MRTGPLAAVALLVLSALLARALLVDEDASVAALTPEPPGATSTAPGAALPSPPRPGGPDAPREDLAGERADSVGAPAGPAAGDAAPPAVRVRVARWTGDALGIPVAGVPVECEWDGLAEDLWLELGRTDEHGRLEVALPEPGRYRFGADEHGLPDGLLPPGDFPANGVEPAPGLTLPVVELAAGESAEVTLWLMEARSVRGRVVDAGGAPAAGAFVRVDAFERRVRVPARSNGGPVGDDGRFVIDGLYPGEYQLSLAGQSWNRDRMPVPDWFQEQTATNGGLRAPPALYLDLRQRSLEGVELCVGRGHLAISGRLVDAEGRPVAGRDVAAEYTHLADGAPDARQDLTAYPRRRAAATCTSDADGAFRLERLERQPLSLVVRGVTVPRLDGGSWWFGRETELFTFDPSRDADESFDVGDVLAPRVPLYRASGTVVIDESQPDAGGFSLGELQLDLHYARDEDLSSLWHDTQPRREYDPRTGRFQYVCITPWETATLWLYPSGQGGRGKAFRLYPKAGVVESDLLWTYP